MSIHTHTHTHTHTHRPSLVAQMVKNLACNTGDLGLISELGRSPGEGNGNHSSILAWEMSWTEELGRLLCPQGRKELDMI